MAKKYVIQVAPLIPLPFLRTQVFSYFHDESLPVGTLVSVPFYFRMIEGVVLKSKPEFPMSGGYRLKKIGMVIEVQLLQEYQIRLAEKLSEYYFSPLGAVLKLAVAKPSKAKKDYNFNSERKLTLGKSGPISKKIISSKKEIFLISGWKADRERLILELVHNCIRSENQCLILVPDIFQAHAIFEKLRKYFPHETALVHSRITKSKHYQCWQDVKSGYAKVIISTKQGVFLPFRQLGAVIVREPRDISHKQWDAMPRYNAFRAARILSRIWRAKLVLDSSDSAPPIFYYLKRNEVEIMNASPKSNKLPEVKTVALENEKRNPNFPISKELENALAEKLGKKKKCVLFINRRGFSNRTICENCRKILKCPKCDRSLVFSDVTEKYACLHCSYNADFLSSCPSCGGYRFSHRGIGTQTVEKKLKRLFPRVPILRIDADVAKSPAKYSKTIGKFQVPGPGILVGTETVLKDVGVSDIGLVGFVSGRDLSSGIEYDVREKANMRIFQALDLVFPDGTLLLQAFWKENNFSDAISKKEIAHFWEREMKFRKKFAYPPFIKIIKLSYRDILEKAAEIEAKKIFDLLFRTGNNKIEILGPYIPFGAKARGYFLRNILVKFHPSESVRNLPVRSVLGGLRKGWSIDIDPVSLF